MLYLYGKRTRLATTFLRVSWEEAERGVEVAGRAWRGGGGGEKKKRERKEKNRIFPHIW